LRRPELNYHHLLEFAPGGDALSPDAAEHVEAEVKYEGYIKRQENQVKKMQRLESLRIPPSFDFAVPELNLSTEARQKLDSIRPQTLGQASRISGVSPADVSSIMVILHTQQQGLVVGEKG
jgi:tRNA uridine 5-carboxymethylaminomethyl modification enzyme